MNNDNPLNNFQTHTYTDFKDKSDIPTVCPTLGQATAQPLKIVDYIGCHKLLMIFIIAFLALLFYSGAKVKAASEDAGGKAGGMSGKK